jgi:hypothetical protein
MAAFPPVCFAALHPADLGVFAGLLVFAWWGARRGALRQFLSVLVLGGTFVAAGHLAPALEPTVVRVTSLQPPACLALAWGAVIFGGLVAGAVVLSFACCRMAPRAARRGDRIAGALLGVLQGGFVLLVVGYALLGVSAARPRPGAPALQRPSAAPPPSRQVSWVGRVRGSLAARGMAAGAHVLDAWLEIPPWVEARVREVNDQLGAGSPGVRRPTPR